MHKSIPAILVSAALLAGCATTPAPPPAPATPPVSLTKVYFYPLQGQSETQQDRDRYECFNWSVRQTGFDPSRRMAPGEQRATVVPVRSPGATIGTAAVIGAMLGAVVAGPHDAAEGAVVGAMAGGVVGTAAAGAEQAQAQQAARYPSSSNQSYDKQAAEYRRAMSACLEGRGYSVK